jgi:hypothetical protein
VFSGCVHPVYVAVQDRGDDRLLVTDVFVDRGPRYACPLGDGGVDAGARLGFKQALLGGVEDPVLDLLVAGHAGEFTVDLDRAEVYV